VSSDAVCGVVKGCHAGLDPASMTSWIADQ
jgi:hypothetical protein